LLSLTVEPGQTVALIGQSGSGKSTAVQLVERFYDPVSPEELKESIAVAKAEKAAKLTTAAKGKKETGKVAPASKTTDGKTNELASVNVVASEKPASSGAVLFDGVDIKLLDPLWLRSKIGLVEQEPTLFSGSVHANIASGKGGVGSATRAEVMEAAKVANAHEFISLMDGGYDAEVGVGGGLVSGGQKQRIAIARAIIGNPEVLLLDEATSALDNESEKLVQAALDGLLSSRTSSILGLTLGTKKRTTIVIAHRLSTIRNADKICILENTDGNGARVVEQGTHDELMRSGGRYVALRAAYDDDNH
jgi:ATP-binding cassette subfamily B (MDR/TAP) protein 1